MISILLEIVKIFNSLTRIGILKEFQKIYILTGFQSAEDLGVKLAEYNFTDSFTITELKPEKLLEGSQLVKINVKEASEDEITKTFCREVNV